LRVITCSTAAIVAASSCSSADDEDVDAVETQPVPDTPARVFQVDGLVPLAVSAGTEGALVIGVSGEGVVLGAGGEQSPRFELPALLALRVTAFGDGFALVGNACVNAAVAPDPCDEVEAVVVVLDPDGQERTRVALGTASGTDAEQFGAGLVRGGGRESILLRIEGEVVELSPDGDVVRSFADPGGELCTVDGALYRLSDASVGEEEAAPSEAPVTAAPASRDDSTTLVVSAVDDDGSVVELDDGRVASDAAAAVAARCVAGGFLAGSRRDPLQQWSPTDGWREAAGSVTAPDEVITDAMTSTGETYVLAADGAVRSVGRLPADVELGIRLPAPVGGPPPGFMVDDSGPVGVACITTLDIAAQQTTDCAIGTLQ